MSLQLAHHAASTQGRSTKPNMDRAVVAGPVNGAFLLVVADGMGGHSGGGLAAELAVETLKEGFLRDGGPPWSEWLRGTIREAHERIVAESQRDPSVADMGSTVVAVVVDGGMATCAHLGDSRGLLIRGDFAYRLTSDHLAIVEPSPENDYGPLVEENKAKGHRYSNVLSRCLGAGLELDESKIDVHEVALSPGDVFVLFSDGVSEFVDERRMHAILAAAGGDPVVAGDTIVLDAVELGSHDHSTALVAVVTS